MIFFRADGNRIIGSGHVMRCLSLAMEFRSMGEECCFVMSDGSFLPAVQECGFPVQILNTDYRQLNSELPDICRLAKELHPVQIVVDSYYVTDNYLKGLKQICSVVYIDDRAAFAYPVDCLVNYNIFSKDLNYEKLYFEAGLPLPEFLSGTNYVPLRREFRQVRRCLQPSHVRDVLISTGGADPIHLSRSCLYFLKDSDGAYDSFCFHFIVGTMNPDAEEITAAADGLKNVVIHKDVRQMRELMQLCDMAVAAAGSTLYELCACGTPTITFILADNQKPGALAFERLGLMVSIGDLRGEALAAEKIFEAVKGMSEDEKCRKAMAEKMRNAVDGYGAERLAAKLCNIRIEEARR